MSAWVMIIPACLRPRRAQRSDLWTMPLRLRYWPILVSCSVLMSKDYV